ncbi:hypothetical protein KII95_08740 [Leuconostoc gelidum subsp. aenigmaticum]|uniref:hypothetical protein n=1 Tax=Leuconostoc gelidum TaxID=1244 RepID=UPI001CC7F393|nr:hypothetical protein [Leuconostoc gelidum]MBZ6004094.1 hypothetical protein [Leuconostoc gelidum subsp. aenigmaticum]
MSDNSPMAQLLINIFSKLKSGTIPVYNLLPESDTPEPFLVLGSHMDDDQLTARNGRETVTTELQIDLFYSINDRLALENDIYLIKSTITQATDRITRVTSQILVDNSIGRDVYHVIFSVTAYI